MSRSLNIDVSSVGTAPQIVQTPPLTSGDGTSPSTPPSSAAKLAGQVNLQIERPVQESRVNHSSAAVLAPLLDVQQWVDEAPAWFISAIVHILALIVLALLFIAQPSVGGFVLRLDPSDSGDDLQSGELDMSVVLDQPLISDDALDPKSIELTDDLETIDSQIEMPVSPLGRELQLNAPPIRMALSGREEGMKEALLAAYGGTAATEDAVRNALGWLSRNQNNRTGLWSLVGPYKDGARNDNPDAATALALLAFQGAGYTPKSDSSDPFTKVVRRGWNSFLKRQQPEGNFFQQGQSHGRFYTEAIAAIAVCELYGMTQDSEYRDPAQRAIDYLVSMQTSEGGWRYYEQSGNDLSVTGWIVMALQSARMAGLDVPNQTFTRIGRFLDSVARDLGSQYAYQEGDNPRRSMTAEGLLCRQYLGWSRSNSSLTNGVDILLENLPSENSREAYYWYYATQVCHHMEGKTWQTWNEQMRVVVPGLQVRTGRERGSWDPGGDGGIAMDGGGRLFITCLCTYMLEVYYRHLPLYQSDALHLMQ